MEDQRIFIDIPHISFEEREKYAGMEVAILDGKIVAVGHTSKEVLEKALEQFPDRREEIAIRYINPEEDLLIL
ncbi:MAG: DUF5678 domain-containing protein [Abditibacteriales bacterium]|nr:DUF5678 domain-containing protein [Abditibacteriales bacterium]